MSCGCRSAKRVRSPVSNGSPAYRRKARSGGHLLHLIPARATEPEHEHHDIRFLLLAGPGQTIQMSDESNDLAWFELADLPALGVDESVLRLAQKTGHALQSGFLPLP